MAGWTGGLGEGQGCEIKYQDKVCEDDSRYLPVAAADVLLLSV